MAKQQNILGPVVRELREKKGIKQEQLVAKLNLLGWDLSRVTLAKIEAQIRCVADYEIAILARSLSIDPPELLAKALKQTPKRRQKSF